jgi:hypothetical protein
MTEAVTRVVAPSKANACPFSGSVAQRRPFATIKVLNIRHSSDAVYVHCIGEPGTQRWRQNRRLTYGPGPSSVAIIQRRVCTHATVELTLTTLTFVSTSTTISSYICPTRPIVDYPISPNDAIREDYAPDLAQNRHGETEDNLGGRGASGKGTTSCSTTSGGGSGQKMNSRNNTFGVGLIIPPALIHKQI